MSGFLKAAGLVFAIIGIWIGIGFYVDGLAGGGGGGEVAGGIDPEVGERLYWGDGQCSTCHKIGATGSATRGPDHEGLFAKATKIAKEKGLSSPTEYLVESIVDPGTYLAEGYGNIMPKVFEPPILLNRDQILAIITYLQSLGGDADVNEALKFKDKIPSASKKKVEPWKAPLTVGTDVGEQGVFFNPKHPASCSKCHTVKGQGTKIGPELTNIGGVQTAQYIVESILSPSNVIVKGFETSYVLTKDGIPYTGIIKSQNDSEIILASDTGGEIEEITIPKNEIEEIKPQDVSMMPGNLGELMSVKEFYGVISYLLTLK